MKIITIALLACLPICAQTLAPPTPGFEYGRVVASGHPQRGIDTCAIQNKEGTRAYSIWTKCNLGELVEFRIEKDKFVWRQPDGKEKKFTIKGSSTK